MTQDEIIRMAREAGIKEQRFCVMCSTGNQLEELERFAALHEAYIEKQWCEQLKITFSDVVKQAVEAEREACAKVCEELRHHNYSAESDDWLLGTYHCAAAIRARGGHD